MSNDGKSLIRRLEDEFPELLTLLRNTPPAENVDTANASSEEMLEARLLSIVGVANARSEPPDTVKISTRDLNLILMAAGNHRNSPTTEIQSLRDELASLRASSLTEDGVRVLMLKTVGTFIGALAGIAAIVAVIVHI